MRALRAWSSSASSRTVRSICRPASPMPSSASSRSCSRPTPDQPHARHRARSGRAPPPPRRAVGPAADRWLGRGGRSLDLGSGGGVPGLVLALARPERPWMLVDSVRKKADVLRDFVSALGIGNVEVIAERAEVLGQRPRPPRVPRPGHGARLRDAAGPGGVRAAAARDRRHARRLEGADLRRRARAGERRGTRSAAARRRSCHPASRSSASIGSSSSRRAADARALPAPSRRAGPAPARLGQPGSHRVDSASACASPSCRTSMPISLPSRRWPPTFLPSTRCGSSATRSGTARSRTRSSPPSRRWVPAASWATTTARRSVPSIRCTSTPMRGPRSNGPPGCSTRTRGPTSRRCRRCAATAS